MKDTGCVGLSKRHLFRLKKRLKEGKRIRIYLKVREKLN